MSRSKKDSLAEAKKLLKTVSFEDAVSFLSQNDDDLRAQMENAFFVG